MNTAIPLRSRELVFAADSTGIRENGDPGLGRQACLLLLHRDTGWGKAELRMKTEEVRSVALPLAAGGHRVQDFAHEQHR